MSKAGVKFSEVKELLMKDEEFKSEYERLSMSLPYLPVSAEKLLDKSCVA